MKFVNFVLSILTLTFPLFTPVGFALSISTTAVFIALCKSAPPNLSLFADKSSSFLVSFNVTLSFGIVIALPVY